MTNKERLEANNAKIAQIQETLKNKILAVVGEKEIEVELPEEFDDVANVYYFKITEEKMLFSGDNSGMGLWLYRIKEKSWKQVSSLYANWSMCFIFGDHCLISGNHNNSGILCYDITSDEVEQIYDSGLHWSSAKSVGDRILIFSSTTSGILSYDITNRTIKKIYDSGSY